MTRRWSEQDVKRVMGAGAQAIEEERDTRVPRIGGKILQLEFLEQKALMDWLEHQYVRIRRPDGRSIEVCVRDFTVASQNGAHLSGDKKARAIQWRKAAQAGARQGYPDVATDIPFGDYHGLRCEMKKKRSDFRSPSEIRKAVSPGQEACLNTLSMLGYFSFAAFGWVEAAKRYCEYFDWDPRSKGLV